MAVVAGMILEGTVGPRMPTRVTSRQSASTTTTGPTVGTGAVGALREWGTRSSRPWVSTVMGKGWRGRVACLSMLSMCGCGWLGCKENACVVSLCIKCRGGGCRCSRQSSKHALSKSSAYNETTNQLPMPLLMPVLLSVLLSVLLVLLQCLTYLAYPMPATPTPCARYGCTHTAWQGCSCGQWPSMQQAGGLTSTKCSGWAWRRG